MRTSRLLVALGFVGLVGGAGCAPPPAPVSPKAAPATRTRGSDRREPGLAFVAPRVYDAGHDAVNVAAGDLDGDGATDLVVTASGDDQVGVLLGAGDGTFRERVAYDAGRGPSGVTLGDLDLDGHLDVVVTDRAGESVSVLMGRGDGTLSVRAGEDGRFPVGPEPVAVAVADFDGDGAPDLAVANRGSDAVSLLRGHGNGSFDARVSWDVRPGATAIVVGDYNADGLPDLAVGAEGGLTIRLGAGQGRFGHPVAMAAGERPTQLVAADLDGNGRPDLVSLAEGREVADGTVSAILSAGNGRFAAPITRAAVMPRALAAGDLDGDGLADLVLASAGARTLTVLPGLGDGSFGAAVSVDAGAPAIAIAAIDLDRDGRLDLTLVTSRGLTVLLQSAP